ncbi:MAG: tripartite tricarboxylate transporter permease [Methanosarcinales archaeon]|jgi:putative membrane protein|nr:tripartite tricarboxylate transporter permease [Methanosarcinales archaeon]
MIAAVFSSLFENAVFGFVFCVTGGWFLGLLTGMIPGIHANNVAVILAGASAFLYSFGFTPVLVSIVILSCAVSHTFHNIIPAVFLGAPGEETVFAVLPGHKLMAAGEGISAVRLSALGSAAAVLFSFLMILPTVFFLSRFYPLLEPKIAFILIILSLIVLISEKKISKIFSAAFVFLTAGILGVIAFEMDGSLNPILFSSSSSVLMPLLGGLFGVPQLIVSLFSKSEVYDSCDTKLNFSSRLFLKNAFLGTAAGAFVSWLPGVSSSVAAVLAGFFKKNQIEENDIFQTPSEAEIILSKEYIVIVSAINTANAVFGLLAFFAIGKSRNGAVVSIRDILSDAGFPLSSGIFSGETFELFILFYSVIMLSSFFSYFSTIYAGKLIPAVFQKMNYQVVSGFVLLLLAFLVYSAGGSYGFILFIISIFVGFLPIVLHVRKSHLMGVILFPVILYFLGLR